MTCRASDRPVRATDWILALAALVVFGVGEAWAAGAWAGNVVAVDNRVEIARGSLDGVSVGAVVGLAPPDYQGERMTEENAPALLTITAVEPERSFGELTRPPRRGRVEPGWIAQIIKQNVPQRASGVRVQVLFDDSNLQVVTTGDGTRGCAGKRKSLRLERAEAATQEITKDLPQEEVTVQVETPTPTPTLTPPPPTPSPTPGRTPRPPRTTPTPTPPPTPAPEHDSAEVADFIVKIVYLGGRMTDEVLANILIIGPGGDTLENVTVPVDQAAPKVRELLDKYIRSEESRQSLLNLHNPEPGFKIELWLNAPGGPSARSESATRSITVGSRPAEPRREETPSDMDATIVLRRGDEHTYGFRSEKNCYLVLYNVGPDGAITQLFPNVFMPDNFIRADTTYTLPDPDYRLPDGSQVIFFVDSDPRKPVGLETIKAIATLERMALTTVDLEQIEREGFPSATPPPPGAQWELAGNSLATQLALTRSISVGTKQPAPNRTPAPPPPPRFEQTLEEVQAYLRDLSRWSDTMITFYTAD